MLVKKSFTYTSVFDTEIEFNDPAYQDNWRNSFVKIKIKTIGDYIKVNGKNVEEFTFEINGTGECHQLKMALLHFAYILETEIMPR
jgi:hypothetical protein